MRTTKPMPVTSLRLSPGRTRAMVLAEMQSYKAMGTRRAVKVSIKVGEKEHVGWVSRDSFKLDSLNRVRGK